MTKKPQQLNLIIIGLIVLVMSLFLFLGSPDSLRYRSLQQVWNTGHIVYFMLLVYLLVEYRLFLKAKKYVAWYSYILLVMILSVFIELMQYEFERQPDIEDILRNLAGCLLVLGFHQKTRISQTYQQRALQIVILVFLAFITLPLARAVYDEIQAWRQFPVLANFESALQLERLEGDADYQIHHTPGSKTAQDLSIRFNTSEYSGVGLKYFPNDWSEYARIVFVFNRNSQNELPVTIRIHDRTHEKTGFEYEDRFNQGYVLQPGPNVVSIDLEKVRLAPLKREMNMRQVAGLKIFTKQLNAPQTLDLQKIYLE